MVDQAGPGIPGWARNPRVVESFLGCGAVGCTLRRSKLGIMAAPSTFPQPKRTQYTTALPHHFIAQARCHQSQPRCSAVELGQTIEHLPHARAFLQVYPFIGEHVQKPSWAPSTFSEGMTGPDNGTHPSPTFETKVLGAPGKKYNVQIMI